MVLNTPRVTRRIPRTRNPISGSSRLYRNPVPFGGWRSPGGERGQQRRGDADGDEEEGDGFAGSSRAVLADEPCSIYYTSRSSTSVV